MSISASLAFFAPHVPLTAHPASDALLEATNIAVVFEVVLTERK
jgi:hypothetical protein